MKIAFVKRHLANIPGGAERALINLANAMAERGHVVTIVTADKDGGEPFYHLNSNVSISNLRDNQKKRKVRAQLIHHPLIYVTLQGKLDLAQLKTPSAACN